MSDNSKIEWTDATWNPVSGCTKISPGCDNCYAERIAERFRGTPGYPAGFDITLHPERLQQPVKWKRPRRIFVNSMSDLFHKDIPMDFLDQVFDVMVQAEQHTFQVLTKRSSRMRDIVNARFSPGYAPPCPKNIWLGVSVEGPQQKSRIVHLQETLVPVRFLSIEPLLAPMGELPLEGIHWVIVGGESGPGARAMHPDWVREIRDHCVTANVPFFFKQWGEWAPYDRGAVNAATLAIPKSLDEPVSKFGKKHAGRCLDGREWNQFPGVKAA